MATERRDNRGVRETGFGLGLLSLANFPLRLRRTPLRRENGELALGLNERRLGAVEGGPFLNEVGVGLLRLLQRPGPLFEQILRAPVLVLGIAQRRLRLRDLERSLLDRRLLGGGLGLGLADAGPGLADLRLRLGEGVAIVPVVEADERLPRFDDLVVGDENVDDRRGNLSADVARPRVDEGVVGVCVLAGVQPPQQAAHGRGQGDDDDQGGKELVPCDPGTDASRSLLLRVGAGFPRAGVGGAIIGFRLFRQRSGVRVRAHIACALVLFLSLRHRGSTFPTPALFPTLSAVSRWE